MEIKYIILVIFNILFTGKHVVYTILGGSLDGVMLYQALPATEFLRVVCEKYPSRFLPKVSRYKASNFIKLSKSRVEKFFSNAYIYSFMLVLLTDSSCRC